MKKGIQESNPVLALWQRVILDGRVRKLAREFRKKLEIPEYGFDSSKSFDTWYKKYKNKNIELKRDLHTKLFIQKCRETIPYKGLMSEIGFQMLMLKFLIYNEINNEYLTSLNNSGTGIKTIKDSKIFYPKLKEYMGEITDGVYIKLKPFSTIDSILKYVENNKNLIRNSLKEYTENINLKKPKRIKTSSHFERDRKILMLSEYSKKDLEDMFNIKGEYKDIVISSLLNKNGYKGIKSSVVKAVRQRRKIK